VALGLLSALAIHRAYGLTLEGASERRLRIHALVSLGCWLGALACGRLIAFGRMDRARPMSVDIALNKAYTAASFQQPTKDLAGVAGQTWFQSLVVSSNGRIMPGGGALPIVEGGSVVGAIAVAGGTEEQDQRCAEVALSSYAA